MSDKEYWEGLDINYEFITEHWEHYKQKLEKYLKQLDDVSLFEISEKLNLLQSIEVRNGNRKQFLIAILNSKDAITIALLKEFHNYKPEIINEHYNRLVEDYKIPLPARTNTFLRLIELYYYNKAELKNLLFFHYWYRNASFSQTYKPSIPLKKEFVLDFEKVIPDFLKELKKFNWQKLGSRDFGKLQIKNKTIFSIIKQTGDKLIRNVDGNKRNKIASDLLLAFDLESDKLEIRCRDSSISSRTVKILEKLIRIHFVKNLGKLDSFDSRVIKSYFESGVEKNNLSIAGIAFRESKIAHSVPIVIPATYKTPSVVKSINELEEKGIITIDAASISSIILRLNDKLRDIEIRRDGEYSYYTLKKKTRMSDQEVNLLSDNLRLILGIGLNERFKLQSIKQNPEEIINKLLSSDKIERDTLSKDELTFYNELVAKQIILPETINIYQCESCRIESKVGGKCIRCQSNMRLIKTEIKTGLTNENIVKYLVPKIEDGKIRVIDSDSVRTWTKKFHFIKIEYKSTNIFVYISFGHISANLVSFFQRSAIPIIIINIGENLSQDIVGLTNLDTIELSRLFLNPEGDTELRRMIEENVKRTNSKIVTAAADSFRKLNDRRKYNHEYFEDDVFNVLKYCFRNIEKWGKEKRFKEIPEGLADIKFDNFTGTNHRTFSWDCKYSYSEAYDLDMDEKRKAESYIRILNKSLEVKNLSKKLSAYFIIANNVNIDKFNRFADYLVQKIRMWKGNIVLIELEELLLFYKLFDEKYSSTMKDHNRFLSEVSELLLTKGKKRYFNLTKEDIESLFDKFAI